MSDTKILSVNGGNAEKPVVIGKDDPVPFTYPEGFNAVANSLQFLPEVSRVQILSAFIQASLV